MKKNTSCNDTIFLPELTIFTATISSIISIIATLTNTIIIIAIYRNRDFFKRRSSFYGLLLNIVLADLMTGVFGCNVSVYYHVKETLRKTPSTLDSRLVHSSILIVNGVAISTLSLLCIERLRAILEPLKHYKNVKEWKLVLLVISTWLLATILIIPYFVYGYIRYLAFFSATSVTLTFIVLMVTTFVYRNHFKKSTANQKRSTRDSSYFRSSSLDSWLAENHSNQPSPHRVPLRLSSCPESGTSSLPRPESKSTSEKCNKMKPRFLSLNTKYSTSKSSRDHNNKSTSYPQTNTHEIFSYPKQQSFLGKLKPKFSLIKTNKNDSSANISTNQNPSKSPLRHSKTNRSIKSIIRTATLGRGTEKSPLKTTPKRSERRIHKCFLKMALVFLLTYLPAVLMIIYMNTYQESDCIVIHVLRDLTAISLLASAALRPINFMLTLKTLRKAILNWFMNKKNQDGGGRHVAMSISSADFLDSFHGSPVKFHNCSSGSPAHFPDRKRMVTL